MVVYAAIFSIVAYPILQAVMTMPGMVPGGSPPEPAALAARFDSAGFGVLGLVSVLSFMVLAGVAIAFMAGGEAAATAALLNEERRQVGFGHADLER